jgi:hypothetical protein
VAPSLFALQPVAAFCACRRAGTAEPPGRGSDSARTHVRRRRTPAAFFPSTSPHASPPSDTPAAGMSTSRSASRAALRLLHSSSASAPHASSSVLAVRSASASTSSVSSPRVSSPRAFGTAAPLRSAWPAGAQPEDADANRRAAPRPPRESGAQPKRFRTKGVRELRELKKEGTPM